MTSPAEGGNGIPAPKCIPSGKSKSGIIASRRSTSHGGLYDVTCHVRVQYISKFARYCWIYKLDYTQERSNDFTKLCFVYD